ncbi:MAG: C40 family peptidase [Lachnospiraceae bacterium]|nr:C40 family peptidase [Lachnospiraceae bacterium]
MLKDFKLNKISVLSLVIACAVVGVFFMTIIDIKASEASKVEEVVSYDSPAGGMSAVVTKYMSSNGESSMELLSTTAVASKTEGINEYYDADGNIIGKLIVCKADEYAPVFMVPDETSGVYAKIYRFGVATLVKEEDGWYQVVSGGVSGYVKSELFAVGVDAEAMNPLTYDTYATVNTDELTLRDDKSTYATALCILSPDSRHSVVAEDEGDGWTKISVDGVGEGYVMTEYLQITKTHKFGVTIDQETADTNAITLGVEEAEAREERWAEEAAEAERQRQAEIAAEEERQRQAEAEAEAERQRQAEASYNDDYYDSDDSYYDDDEDEYVSYYSEPEVDDSSVSSERASLVAYARSFVGWLPYVSGGHSLEYGADCSGFTASIYAAFGYSIPYSSDAQAYCGYSVSLSDIQPGDLLIYSGHVAIYSGNGCKIHSPYPGQVVTENSMYNMTLLDIRRIID